MSREFAIAGGYVSDAGGRDFAMTTAYLSSPTVATGMRGMKVWNGSAWVEKPAKVWSGAAWAQKPVKIWNGSAWV